MTPVGDHEKPPPPLELPWPPLTHMGLRLTLRPWGADPADAELLASAWADPDIVRWTRVPAASSVDDAARWIRGEEERRRAGLAVDLVISELDDPTKVHGEVGLALVEQHRRWAELGYWLFPASRGAGRAGAAAKLVVDWALEAAPVRRVIARAHPDNPAARRVAEAAGLEVAGRLDGDGPEVLVRDHHLARPAAGTLGA